MIAKKVLLLILLLPFFAHARAQAAPVCGKESACYIHRQGNQTLPDLFNAARKEGKPIVVMFTADWCSPCKAIKSFVKKSKVVQKAIAGGKLLYIDVDEWRGPAHALIAGINPTKLPTLVRVNAQGQQVVTCYGTDLGLLSEESVAHNLRRLWDGKMPEKAFYEGKAELEHKLILEQNDAQNNEVKGKPELELSVLNKDPQHRTVKLLIRNNVATRRWYVVPMRADKPLFDVKRVLAWQTLRWPEHVRASYIRLDGEPPMAAMPVNGLGSVELDGWPLPGTSKNGQLEIWELEQLQIGTQVMQIEQKLPYELKILEPAKTATTQPSGDATDVQFKIRKKHQIPLK